MKNNYDVIVIGAGPAGLAAAIEAKKTGAKDVLIIERNNEPGGILLQCIHNGFGSVIFKKDLPGPAYASNFIDEAKGLEIEMLFDTMVLDLTPERKIYAANSSDGFIELYARAVVLAMGCRERTRAQIRIPGERPAGVYTAGMVQRLVNIEGYMPGKNFVILGSGDIGMIMARRLTIEGANVIKVVELLPYLTGLRRNYVQCLNDFNIPLELSTTIKRIIGKKRVEAVETVKVDESLVPVAGTEKIITCDTLLLSVGLIPENELSRKAGVALDPLTLGPVVDEKMSTNVAGIFAAGNVVTIYDLVDYVSAAGSAAGISAAHFAAGAPEAPDTVNIIPGDGVRSVIPQKISSVYGSANPVFVELRVSREFSEKISINITDNGNAVYSHMEKYARPAEMITLKINWNELSKKLSKECKDLTVSVVKNNVKAEV
ncbi:MAG: FAD-dependent oxidoreductase [Candidatus Goldiibacteriota bacterium]|jgi:thioredoxin reductase